MQRQFTSGSRQAPDPFDQFLEEHQYYRKHTARDASCLFRVISEQMYDTQLHHLVIREKCVTYMRKHRKHFEYHVDRDFDEYLDDMSKPKTYGTLLELQAASYMFERNVFLFQPFNLGNYFDEYRSNFVEVFRVFYTPERHFDSVFTSDYIQEAAICQSICYEILYKDVFELPDVSFAVEQMLHGPTFENMDYRTETNEEGYSTHLQLSDGRLFELDLPENTNCILENYKLCHFHYINFPLYADDLQRELKSTHSDEYDKNSLIIQRTAESFLPNKYVSCVRQLLQEGITPFPYKVAKALDPNMYRNIEFDSWNEMRKEMKLQNWYNGDANFKVGAKCHVKLRKSEQDLYTCHIQEIAVDKGQCIVFVEQLGEKLIVPYENLTPLPPEQFKPWTVPYRLQRHMQKYSSLRFTRQYNYRFKFNSTEHHHHHEFACETGVDGESCSNSYIDDDPKHLMRQQKNLHCSSTASYFKLKQYTHLEDFRTHVEYCTMPVTVTHSNREVDVTKAGGNQSRVTTDSTEISRTPSRSSASAVMNRNNVDGGAQSKTSPTTDPNSGEEHLAAPQSYTVSHIDGYDMDQCNPAFYMPEMQGLQPVYPYSGMSDDYYGYCGLEGILPVGPAIMPPMNNINGFYYVCNNALPPPANYINSPNASFAPSQPPQSVGIAQSAPMLASANSQNPLFYAKSQFPSAASSTQSTQSSPAALTNTTPSHLPHKNVANTPTKNSLSGGRINYDAKKSLKSNGIDLPHDVATLRFFYNMGLDYYAKQKSNSTEPETINDQPKYSNELQNMKSDENGNTFSISNAGANSNLNGTQNDAPHALDANITSNQATNKQNNNINVNTGGIKNHNNNNQRRYSSRYFSGKDRQMLQRNNPNQGSGQQQQQYHQYYQHNAQHRGFNANNNNCPKYSHNNYNVVDVRNNTARNAQHQNNQQHNLQTVQNTNSQQLSHAQAIETSPNSAFDESSLDANSAEPGKCHTPLNTNNSNVAYSSNSEQINMGNTAVVGSNGQLAVSMQPNAGGVYIPIAMATGPAPPPPYGVFAPHPTAGMPHQAPGVAIHPSFLAGPPPQVMTHCGLAVPQQQCTLNSGPGMDVVENVCTSDIPVAGGALMAMPSPGMQVQCPNYPPPMPFYIPANGINSVGGSVGGLSAPLPAPSNGVRLVAPFPHHLPPPSTPTNQTSFSSQHPSLGSQGYYCLQPPPPPPPLLPPQQQVTQPQLVQQSTQISANKSSASISMPHDMNNSAPQHIDVVPASNDE